MFWAVLYPIRTDSAVPQPIFTNKPLTTIFLLSRTAASAPRQAPHAATVSTTPTSAVDLLNKQRAARPVAPHLSIYRPQTTWVLSGLNRVTGVALSGGFYLFGLAYLAAPVFGWHLESASIAAAFASLPILVKVLAKFTVAWPFTFHTYNSMLHLIWDTGSNFTNSQVRWSGWTVVGLSFVTAIGLVFW